APTECVLSTRRSRPVEPPESGTSTLPGTINGPVATKDPSDRPLVCRAADNGYSWTDGHNRNHPGFTHRAHGPNANQGEVDPLALRVRDLDYRGRRDVGMVCSGRTKPRSDGAGYLAAADTDRHGQGHHGSGVGGGKGGAP